MASIARGRYLDPAGTRGDADFPARDQAHRLGQQVVLQWAQRVAYGRRVGRLWELQRALEDDRSGVHALVDEVHGDAEHLHAVGERLLDRGEARKGGQQRRVDVDHALRELPQERGREELHVAGEHDEPGVGRTRAVEVLRGGRSKVIAKYSYDGLPGYGTYGHLRAESVLERVDALLQAGTLRSTGGRFPKLEVA